MECQNGHKHDRRDGTYVRTRAHSSDEEPPGETVEDKVQRGEKEPCSSCAEKAAGQSGYDGPDRGRTAQDVLVRVVDPAVPLDDVPAVPERDQGVFIEEVFECDQPQSKQDSDKPNGAQHQQNGSTHADVCVLRPASAAHPRQARRGRRVVTIAGVAIRGTGLNESLRPSPLKPGLACSSNSGP